MGRTHSRIPAAFICLFSALGLTATVEAQDYPDDFASREDTVRLEPNSAWNIDHGQKRCRLARWFGEQSDPYLLIFEQSAPRRSFDVTIAGRKVGRIQRARSISIGMERDEHLKDRTLIGRSELEGVGKAIVFGNYPLGPKPQRESTRNAGINLDEASTIDRVVVTGGSTVLSFETGNMRAPLNALNTCTDGILARWGLDPEIHQSFVPPRLLDKDAISERIEARYPREALRRNEQSIVAFSVIVEMDGSVSNCMADNTTPSENLRSPACEVMATARFEPARDANGDLMRSYYSRNIIYSIR